MCTERYKIILKQTFPYCKKKHFFKNLLEKIHIKKSGMILNLIITLQQQKKIIINVCVQISIL